MQLSWLFIFVSACLAHHSLATEAEASASELLNSDILSPADDAPQDLNLAFDLRAFQTMRIQHRVRTVQQIVHPLRTQMYLRSMTMMRIQALRIQNMRASFQRSALVLQHRMRHIFQTRVAQRCVSIQQSLTQRALQAYLTIQARRRQILIQHRLISAHMHQFHLIKQRQVAMLAIMQSQLLFRQVVQNTILANIRVAHLGAYHIRLKTIACGAWISRFVQGMQVRRQLTLRSFLVGVRGWMTSATNIAAGWIKAFIHAKRASMMTMRHIFLGLFQRMQLSYTTFAPHINYLVIGQNRFIGAHLVAKWNTLHALVYQVLLGRLNLRAFIVQVQVCPSYLAELQGYILKLAATYKANLLAMVQYRVKLQALFYFYARVYLLSMIRQTVIAGGNIHAATFIEMRDALLRFYKLIQIFIIAPTKNPWEHITLPPIIFPIPGPKPKPKPKPTPKPGTGGTEIEGRITVSINGKQRSVDIKNAAAFVKETLTTVKGSMSQLISSVIAESIDLTGVISLSQKVSGNLQVLVTVYKFVRDHQKQLFAIYNELKDDALAAFDFIEKTLTAQMEKTGGQTPLIKEAGDKFEATLQLYDLLHSAYVGGVEDKQNYVQQYPKLFQNNDVELLKVLRSGLKRTGDARKGVALVAPVYVLSVFEKLSFCAWNPKQCGNRLVTV